MGRHSPLWRYDEPLLDGDNIVIRGGMWRHQQEWWSLPNFVKALVTGYGGGKTYIGAKRAIAAALTNAPVPFACVSPTFKLARRTSVRAIKALLAGKETLLGKKFRWKYHETHHEFRIWYKGREAIIWVMSGEDPDALRGPNLGGAWIDEPFIQEEAVFEQMHARVRDPRALSKEILLTGTPEQLNWGYDICEGERKGDFDLGLVQAHTRANLALDGIYADRLEQALDEKAAEAYLAGKFVNLQKGRVYYAFTDDNIREIEDPGGPLKLGLDFNVNPMAGVVFWEHAGHVHVVDEIELDNSDTEYMMAHIKDEYYEKIDGEKIPRISDVYPDASGRSRSTKAPGGRSDFHFIRAAGCSVHAKASNPIIRDRENAVNGLLNHGRLTISPKCQKLKSYMLKYTHEGKNKQKDMSHLLDALGYPVHYLHPVNRGATTVATVGH